MHVYGPLRRSAVRQDSVNESKERFGWAEPRDLREEVPECARVEAVQVTLVLVKEEEFPLPTLHKTATLGEPARDELSDKPRFVKPRDPLIQHDFPNVREQRRVESDRDPG